MKRWPLRILICLVLGAVTTVAVAWGCALWSVSGNDLEWGADPTIGGRSPVAITPAEYQHLAGFGVTEPENCRLLHGQLEGCGFRRSEYWLAPVEEREGEFVVIGGAGQVHRETFAGWPFFAMFCHELDDSERLYQADPGLPRTQRELWPLKYGFDIEEEIDLGGPWTIQRPIPLRPIWPGFVIDTLFYAAIWFGVFFGFASAKRFIRVKRGRCPRCGYDLRGGVMSDKRLAMSGEGAASTAGCPECGWGRAVDSSRRDDGM